MLSCSKKRGLVVALGLACVIGGILWGYAWRQEPLFHVGLILFCLAWYACYKFASAPWLRALALAFCFMGGFTCASSMVVNSYLLNYRGFFYLGLFLELDLLILYCLAYRPHSLARLAINTGILGILLLPVVDLCTSPPHGLSALHPSQRPYAYEIARQNPVRFQIWWDRYLQEWDKVGQMTGMPDPTKRVPFRLKPNTTAKLFDSEIRINSLGFRDEEFSIEKGNTYRIVALGESTTMGCTMEASDTPWPKVLERMLRERLPHNRPIQVINAGVWAYSLAENLARMGTDILPLQPDMIISYHGYNGFPYLDNALAPVLQPDPPPFIARPVFLLARVEHRLRVAFYRRELRHPDTDAAVTKHTLMNPLDSTCGRLYEQLIEVTRTNHVRLVLANFNLAVDPKSHPDVIEFYRMAFPQVHSVMRANDAHSRLLEQLAQMHPEILLVNAQSNLHGHHDQFIDLVHFTQAGRDQLAANIFTGIQGVLTNELNPARR